MGRSPTTPWHFEDLSRVSHVPGTVVCQGRQSIGRDNAAEGAPGLMLEKQLKCVLENNIMLIRKLCSCLNSHTHFFLKKATHIPRVPHYVFLQTEHPHITCTQTEKPNVTAPPKALCVTAGSLSPPLYYSDSFHHRLVLPVFVLYISGVTWNIVFCVSCSDYFCEVSPHRV